MAQMFTWADFTNSTSEMDAFKNCLQAEKDFYHGGPSKSCDFVKYVHLQNISYGCGLFTLKCVFNTLEYSGCSNYWGNKYCLLQSTTVWRNSSQMQHKHMRSRCRLWVSGSFQTFANELHLVASKVHITTIKILKDNTLKTQLKLLVCSHIRWTHHQ